MAAPSQHDLLLRPGITTTWGIRWEQSRDGGHTFEPVSWEGWTATAELRSETGERWWTGPVSLEASGLARIIIHADALTATAWEHRGHGHWSVTATHMDGRIERVGEGHFYLER